jgi:citrate synthase
MADVLFEITTDHLETGMRGFPVGYCPTSHVDPQKGLFYGDYPVSQIASWEPSEAIYLLYHGEKGSTTQVADFFVELAKRARISQELTKQIEALPREAHPMKLFSAALLLCGMLGGSNDYREDCLSLIAKIPHLAAVVINHHAGWGKTPAPNWDLGYMGNFSHLLNVPGDIDREKLTEVFKLFNLLHYDHGGGNLSAFTGKAIASGLEDLYGSIAGAMCALAGPRHGKANQDCLQFVQEALDALGGNATEREVEQLIRNRLANKELLYGFGHAVLRVEDPRATVLYDVAHKHFPADPLVRMALLLRKVGSAVLKENPKVSDPYPNVDAISGTLLSAAGFPFPDYFTVLFGVSRCVGISIQIVYERLEARGGKGTPIVRPKYLYRKRQGQRELTY